MRMHEQWQLHCASGKCHWVSMCTVWLSHSKWPREQSKESASNFALSLNIPPPKLFRWFRRPQLGATGDWQLPCDNVPAHASRLMQSFFWETSNHPGDSAPLQPRFGALWLLAFPKTKITFEKEEIPDHQWDSGKYHRTADRDWENCVRSQGAYFGGDWAIIVLCTMFLISCIFFNKCLIYFPYYMAGYLLDSPRVWADVLRDLNSSNITYSKSR